MLITDCARSNRVMLRLSDSKLVSHPISGEKKIVRAQSDIRNMGGLRRVTYRAIATHGTYDAHIYTSLS